MTVLLSIVAMQLAIADSDARLMRAIAQVESGNRPQARGDWRYVHDVPTMRTQSNGNAVRSMRKMAVQLVRSNNRANQTVQRLPTSWGAYQFGRARWAESGGRPADWGRAGRAEQNRVMRQALANYRRAFVRRYHRQPTECEWVCWAGRAHNSGSGSLIENRYTRKLRRAMKG